METSESLRRDAYLRELREQSWNETGIEPERLHFTSLLVLYNNVLQSLFQSQIMTLGAVFIAIGLMFWVLFRSLSIALLALAPNVLAAGLVLGLMGLAGIPLDIMTITIAAIVVGMGWMTVSIISIVFGTKSQLITIITAPCFAATAVLGGRCTTPR
jgi:predicted RND superfamily exporter protein